MAKSRRDADAPLTRWKYFTKNLYNNSAKSATFSYNKMIYNKSEELMDIEDRSSKINAVLLLGLVLMFLVTAKVQNIWVVIAYLVLVVIGQIVRLFMLPRDIGAHLTDSGYRER